MEKKRTPQHQQLFSCHLQRKKMNFPPKKTLPLNPMCQLQIYSIIPIHHHKNVAFLYKNKNVSLVVFNRFHVQQHLQSQRFPLTRAQSFLTTKASSRLTSKQHRLDEPLLHMDRTVECIWPKAAKLNHRLPHGPNYYFKIQY